MAHGTDSLGRMRCSYKRSTALVCSINAFAAFYVLHGLLSLRNSQPESVPVSLLRASPLRNGTAVPYVMKYSEEEVERVKEAHEARRAVEPRDLIKRVKEIQLESLGATARDKAAEILKENVAAELAQRLKELKGTNPLAQQDALNEWRKKKIREARDKEDLPRGKELLDAGSVMEEEIMAGLLVGEEKSSGAVQGGKLLLKGPEIEDGIIPGRPVPKECNAEPHADYDGVAVRWGLTHHQDSAADCCQACLDQARSAKRGDMKCNVWVYCPSEEGCFSPDIYEHKQFECWLKQSDKPTLNFKGQYSAEYRQSHPNCPQVVAWASGVLTHV